MTNGQPLNPLIATPVWLPLSESVGGWARWQFWISCRHRHSWRKPLPWRRASS